MHYIKVLGLGLLLIAMVGCAHMTERQQHALSGGAIGATGGAVMGAIVGGNPAAGAAIGGAVGTATGAFWQDIKKNIHGKKRH